MTHKSFYILHLSGHWVRWVHATQDGALLTLKDCGQIEGQGLEALEQWQTQREDQRAAVVLFDGRGMTFNFMAHLPASARKEKGAILGLRVRQELGLEESQIYWGASEHKAQGAKGPCSFFTFVMRRGGVDELVHWRRRHKIQEFWLGPDVVAVHALLTGGALEPGARVLNANGQGLTAYHLTEGGTLMRKHQATLTCAAEQAWALLGPPSSRQAHQAACTAAPQFSIALARLVCAAQGGKPLVQGGDDQTAYDAVLLGGALMLATCGGRLQPMLNAPGACSRAAGVAAGRWLERMEWSRHRLRPIAVATALTALALVMSVGWLMNERGKAEQKLTAQAAQLAPQITLLRGQETLLRRIKAERAPMIPIIQALTEAAPPQVILKSYSVGPTGLIQISGTVQEARMANDFFEALSRSPLLSPVQLPEIRVQNPGNKISFHMTAQIKGRNKK